MDTNAPPVENMDAEPESESTNRANPRLKHPREDIVLQKDHNNLWIKPRGLHGRDYDSYNFIKPGKTRWEAVLVRAHAPLLLYPSHQSIIGFLFLSLRHHTCGNPHLIACPRFHNLVSTHICPPIHHAGRPVTLTPCLSQHWPWFVPLLGHRVTFCGAAPIFVLVNDTNTPSEALLIIGGTRVHPPRSPCCTAGGSSSKHPCWPGPLDFGFSEPGPNEGRTGLQCSMCFSKYHCSHY